MIHVPTSPAAHYVGDAAAWIGAALAVRWQYRRWPGQARLLSRTVSPTYFVALALSAVAAVPSHSIGGALAGGIVAVEAWKLAHGVRISTGGALVLPICIGIVIGRLGCLFAGLPDFTYAV